MYKVILVIDLMPDSILLNYIHISYITATNDDSILFDALKERCRCC